MVDIRSQENTDDLRQVKVGVLLNQMPDNLGEWLADAAAFDAAGRGFTGLVVPVDPRLLDILRNPDDPGDRHDLQLAQG